MQGISFKGPSPGETEWVVLDRATNGLEAAGVVVNQEHVLSQGRGGDHRVRSPTREALLAGFHERVRTLGRCRRLAKQRGCFSRNAGHALLHRAHETKVRKVVPTGALHGWALRRRRIPG